MPHRLGALLVLFALLPDPAAASEPDEAGWERFDGVPAWVTEVPRREGMISAADVGQSNRLELAFDPAVVPRDRLNLRWQIERRLRPLLGAGAREPALAGARAATVVRKAYHHRRARRPGSVGGQVYSAFVLWETPLDTVLASVPEAQRADAATTLQRPQPRPTWLRVNAEPAWVASPPARNGMFVAVAREVSSSGDVARAVADLRGRGHVLHQIQGRLRFFVGNDLAYQAAEEAVSYGRVLERAATQSPGRAWMLWGVPVPRILAQVPPASRSAVTQALGQPIPPKPWTWQSVDVEPAWVRRPPRWPDHLPYVQMVESELPDVVRKDSIRMAEPDIRADLEALLRPLVGVASADEAARAGAKGRVQGAHALLAVDRGPGPQRVRAWTLWQIPIAKVLEVLDPGHHAAVRDTLTAQPSPAASDREHEPGEEGPGRTSVR